MSDFLGYLYSGCEECEKEWEECCGKDCTPEELERIEREMEKLSPPGGMVDTLD